jgi:hypothetical protein
MAKRQDEDLADLADLTIEPVAVQPAAVQPAPAQASALVQVRALVPMWGGDDQVIAVGTVYGLPAAVAADLAGRGMVAIEEAG